MNYRQYVTAMTTAAVAATLLIPAVAPAIAQSAGTPGSTDSHSAQAPNNQNKTGLGTYQVLNQYTDIKDNGKPVNVIVGGSQVSFQSNALPFIAGGVIMTPVLPVLQAAKGHVSWTSNKFTAYGSGEPLTGKIGSRIVHGSGVHRFTLPAAPQRKNGVVYVPIQFLALVTGQKLSFDRDSQTMTFGSPASASASSQP